MPGRVLMEPAMLERDGRNEEEGSGDPFHGAGPWQGVRPKRLHRLLRMRPAPVNGATHNERPNAFTARLLQRKGLGQC
jgi:hypothetical protein